jgi:hypothetical protein
MPKPIFNQEDVRSTNGNDLVQECILVLVYGTVQTLDEADIKNLDKIKAGLVEDYSRGKINDNRYESIKNEISMLYEEIYDKKISSLNDILHKIKTENSQIL